MYLNIAKLAYFFYQKNKFSTNSVSLISGGCDSILLLFIITYINQIINKKNSILHYNHLWQNSTFFISNDLNRLSYIFNKQLILTVPISVINTETKSRTWRKFVSNRISQLYCESILYTGHTQTDNVETSLWNLIRGSGPEGLRGLKTISITNVNFYFSNQIYTTPYLRKTLVNVNSTVKVEKPLLSISRFLSQKCIKQEQFPYWIDKTNLVKKYTRTKIRYIILPLLRYYFPNNSIESSICNFNQLTLEDTQFLSNILQKICFELLQTNNSKQIRELFNKLPINLQKKILFQCIYKYTSKIPKHKLIETLIKNF